MRFKRKRGCFYGQPEMRLICACACMNCACACVLMCLSVCMLSIVCVSNGQNCCSVTGDWHVIAKCFQMRRSVFYASGCNESVWMCLHSVQNFCLLSIASVSNGQNCCLHACVQALNFLKRGWFLEPPEMRSRNGERSPSLHQVCVCWRCLQYLYIF